MINAIMQEENFEGIRATDYFLPGEGKAKKIRANLKDSIWRACQ